MFQVEKAPPHPKGMGGAYVKWSTHPYHPDATPLGFIAALAPKVSGASLSLGLVLIWSTPWPPYQGGALGGPRGLK